MANGRIRRAARAADVATKDRRGQGVIAMLFGLVLVGLFIVFVPIEDVATGGVGLLDDPIFIPIGGAGVALFLWGISRFVGRA